MCLILIAWQTHPDYPLVIAANRDEYFERPTAPAHFWEDAPHIFAGRDLQARGTWLGITRTGHFSALTNVREAAPALESPPSRGELGAHFLRTMPSPAAYAAALSEKAHHYAGFNLLVGDRQSLFYITNRGEHGLDIRELAPGIYGLSNHRIDTPWPKLVRAKSAFIEAIAHLPAQEPFMTLLSHDERAKDQDLPTTGVPLPWERILSSIFVKSDTYGTRASCLVRADRLGHVEVIEQSFDHRAHKTIAVSASFQCSA